MRIDAPRCASANIGPWPTLVIIRLAIVIVIIVLVIILLGLAGISYFSTISDRAGAMTRCSITGANILISIWYPAVNKALSDYIKCLGQCQYIQATKLLVGRWHLDKSALPSYTGRLTCFNITSNKIKVNVWNWAEVIMMWAAARLGFISGGGEDPPCIQWKTNIY